MWKGGPSPLMMYKGMGGDRAGWGGVGVTRRVFQSALSSAAARRTMTHIITLYDVTYLVSEQIS